MQSSANGRDGMVDGQNVTVMDIFSMKYRASSCINIFAQNAIVTMVWKGLKLKQT